MKNSIFPEQNIYEPSPEMVKAAAMWKVELDSETVNQANLANFEHWYQAHPAHAIAYSRLSEFLPASRQLKIDSKAAIQAIEAVLITKKKLPKKSVSAFISIGLIALVASYISFKTDTAQYLLADYKTSVGEQRTIDLDDHSRITLNTNSAINVIYDSHQRLIQLIGGEVLLEVAKDPSRPFLVQTDHGTARALGTRYIVKSEDEATTVAVIESTVEACTDVSMFTKQQPKCIRLHPDQATVLQINGSPVTTAVDAQALASWSTGIIAIDNQPLDNVIAQLERYRRGQIILGSDDLANLRVSGVFPVNDTDRALQMLSDLLPVEYKTYTAYITVIDHKSKQEH